jgi:MYXO-CTERM domain-containing protein
MLLLALRATVAHAGGSWLDPDPLYCSAAPAVLAPSAAADEACVRTKEVGTFSPTVKWSWRSNATHAGYDDVMMTPVIGNLTDDNSDGVIDGSDTADVLFTAAKGSAYGLAGVLVSLRGSDGALQWSLTSVTSGTSTYSLLADAAIALGDLDADGKPDIVTLGIASGGGTRLLALEADGTVKWVATPTTSNAYAGPAIADLDGDGYGEVIYYDAVYEYNGTKRFDITASLFPFALNWDSDDALEVVSSGKVYEPTGTLITTIGSGNLAPGDFDLDGQPDLVVKNASVLAVYKHSGAALWSITSPWGSCGVVPTVADFDGDGIPDVAMAGNTSYKVFDGETGAVLWSKAIVDSSSCVTGSSVFDFDGDGAAEVVYADERVFYVLDGATGAVEYSNSSHASGTLFEYPLVADVDGDGASDIIIPSNDYTASGDWTGITVLSDSTWQPSRSVWNQHAYSITNINDDLSLPYPTTDNWDIHNDYRCNAPVDRPVDWQVNLGIDGGVEAYCFDVCTDPGVEISVPVANNGRADSSAVVITFTRADGTVVATYEEAGLDAGSSAVYGPYTFTQSDWGAGNLSVSVADVSVTDCDTLDDAYNLGAWEYPSLDADGDGVTADACGGVDCDDTNATIYPSAPELDDDLDNDCNGVLDDPFDDDADGLTNGQEVTLGTSTTDDDTDDDGLLDGTEVDLATDPLDTDTDSDGLTDGLEVGLTAPEGAGTDLTVFVADADPTTTTDPTLVDTDDDGVIDGAEDHDLDGAVGTGELDPNVADTDGDGLIDGVEDANGDGLVSAGESGGADDDTDDDGLTDGDEITAGLDPTSFDTDGDGVSDGVEVGLTSAGGTGTDPAVFVADADPKTTTDPLNADTDGDGLADGDEDLDGDGALGLAEVDPNDDDTDDDGRLDGSEDADGDGVLDDGETSPRDADTDADGLLDGTEVGLAAPEGDDTDAAVFVADADPKTTTDPRAADTDAGSAGDGVEDIDHDGAVDAGECDPLDPLDDRYCLDTDGDGASDGDELDAGTDPADADSDDDGLSDVVEVGLGLDPSSADSDGDGVQDGTELGVTEGGAGTGASFVPDSDPSTTTDPRDADSDDDGLADGAEDVDADGAASDSETDAANADTDDDGVQDGTELGLTEGGAGTGASFVPDADPATTTDPLDADADDDGLADGTEDTDGDGAWGDGETNPLDADSDEDGVQDGTELGVTEAGPGTDPAEFVPDADPTTVTDPLDADTDDGGVSDGVEDADRDGAIDDGECDPRNGADDGLCVDTDEDGLSDAEEVEMGTDPLDDDTDDDGLLDGEDPNPLVAEVADDTDVATDDGIYKGGICGCVSAADPRGVGLFGALLAGLLVRRRRR